MSEEQKAEQLAHLSGEIERLIDRVATDVREQRGDGYRQRASGFVIYLLHNSDKSPVESVCLREAGIAPDDITQTNGFSALKNYCERLSLHARVEDTIRPSRGIANPCLGIIVDGWP
ncbi:hypothetical protein NUH88_03380 [Nisaea acidiphila]|uniref:Uncharacterized protein n=1 Tax=Nisaea acidiphila TaxID=1862145 RepID=A0A9J7AVB6_9PROT|nr:hypothetical protein [Nisaea acidiphila]UUX50746.1 hypothetical protein NUH88_03380 [Nisaea acidiphila]